MPNIIRQMVRGAKRRIRRGLRDGRTWSLHDAALRRLASKDYERISIAELARGAGCSVGAFYNRFRDKDTFLQMVIVSAFQTLTEDAQRDLDPTQWRHASKAKMVGGIVRHIANQMSQGKAAGVTRAALKLGMTNPHALEPFLNYRASVADCAVALLVPKLSFDDAARSVRIAVQMVFGIVTDATLQNAGPLRAGGRRMTNSLTTLMASYLNLPAERRSREGDDEDEAVSGPEPHGAEEPGALADASNDQAERSGSDTKTSIGTVAVPHTSHRRSRRRQDPEPQAKPLPVEEVKHAKALEPIKTDERRTRPGRDRKRKVRRL